ncbi:MAG TPA: hypothetical protein VEH04_10300 [Verrucomicrobiae bacterium]|nr:hypothetical protein [Verrucomicrobiae bacterium]
MPATETVLLGRFARGPLEVPLWVDEAGFHSTFGSTNPASWPAEVQACQFFANGGAALHVIRVTDTGSLHDNLIGDSNALTGLNAVAPLSNTRLLIVPELALLNAQEFSSAFPIFHAFVNPRRIFMILDPPPGLPNAEAMIQWAGAALPLNAKNCAIYFPYLEFNLNGAIVTVAASGAMAAIHATSAAGQAPWNVPAGSAYPLNAANTTPIVSSAASDLLAANNINPIRNFAGTGIVPWSARTLDRQDLENRQLAAIRTRSWIAASIQRSVAFAATNHNATPLWTQLRAAAENFLHSLFQQGAFAGTTSSQAYFVRCDETTTTAGDIAQHRAILLYGVAESRPAEFVITSLAVSTSDPERAASPSVLHLRPIDDQDLQIAYSTEPGFAYDLEFTSDLKTGDWHSTGTAAGDGAWRRPMVQILGSEKFFRLRIAPMPAKGN